MIKTFYKTEDGEQFDDLQQAQAHEYGLIQRKDNQVQELMFELMKIASFNGFDGEATVKKLKKRPDLWHGVTMDSDGNEYAIRDIHSGIWNVDTVYILPKEGKEEELKKWAKTNLHPEEMSWVKKGNLKVLSLWWD